MKILLLITLINAVTGQHLKKSTIQKIDHSPGIYFERMQDIKFPVAQWKVLVFINHESLDFKPEPMKAILKEMLKTCENSQGGEPTKHFCRVFNKRLDLLRARLDHLVSLFYEIADTMEEVEEAETQDTSKIRTISKRSAPLAFIGSISHVLFGTLSEDEGKFYSEKINELFKGQVRLAHLAKENIHIVQHKLNQFEERLNTQEKAMNLAFAKLKKIQGISDLSNIYGLTTFELNLSAVTNEISRGFSTYFFLFRYKNVKSASGAMFE